MPIPQLTLYSERLESMKKTKDKSFFFHYFQEHWALSYFSEHTVYLYDSLQPKHINSDLCKQIVALYGSDVVVKIPLVQLQKGYKDCGCCVIVFCVSLMFGDDPAALCYDQKEFRRHISISFETEYFTPFPSVIKKSRISFPLEIKSCYYFIHAVQTCHQRYNHKVM